MAHTYRVRLLHQPSESTRRVPPDSHSRWMASRKSNNAPGKHLEVEFLLDSSAYEDA